MMRLFPYLNLIRMPDVAFVSKAQLRASASRYRPVPQLSPELAVEVISEGNTAAEMDRKRREYFDAEVRLVWIFRALTRTVDVHTPDKPPLTLGEGQTLDGSDVLPGFSLELTPLFAELDAECDGA
jgi:Uma2 family endonuclease